MDIRFRTGMFVVFALAVLFGILAGRSQSSSVAATGPTVPVLPSPVPTPLPNHIDIVTDSNPDVAGRFNPAVLTVHVGQKVTWTNTTGTPFNATADNGAFTTDVLGAGQQYTWTAKGTGTYTYSDYLHPNVGGTIIVQP